MEREGLSDCVGRTWATFAFFFVKGGGYRAWWIVGMQEWARFHSFFYGPNDGPVQSPVLPFYFFYLSMFCTAYCFLLLLYTLFICSNFLVCRREEKGMHGLILFALFILTFFLIMFFFLFVHEFAHLHSMKGSDIYVGGLSWDRVNPRCFGLWNRELSINKVHKQNTKKKFYVVLCGLMWIYESFNRRLPLTIYLTF